MKVYYGAGYLEGYLTCDYIATFHNNYYVNTFEGDPPSDQLKEFVETNEQYVFFKCSRCSFADFQPLALSLTVLLLTELRF